MTSYETFSKFLIDIQSNSLDYVVNELKVGEFIGLFNMIGGNDFYRLKLGLNRLISIFDGTTKEFKINLKSGLLISDETVISELDIDSSNIFYESMLSCIRYNNESETNYINFIDPENYV